MNAEQIRQDVDRRWDTSIVPALQDYIRIPNQSPLFDPQWKKNGHMDAAVNLARRWAESQGIKGLHIEVVESEGKTPLIYIEVDGNAASTVLMYGHLDKQPAMHGWEEGLGPWTPVIRDGKLYGRGSADDGYAIFAALGAIAALQKQGAEHSRIVTIIEADEESGSGDLPYYIDKLAKRIGTPRLIVCLDSGCGNYDQMWLTTSLRGVLLGTLTVEVLKEGVHSGDASGIVPSSFRILRALLERLEDAETGRIKPEWLWVDIPPHRIDEARQTAKILGEEIWKQYPWMDGMRPITKDPVDLLLNKTWRPMLAITGQEGMPALVQAGNVLRPKTAVKVSLRTPPTLKLKEVGKKLKTLFQNDVPYGAKVTFQYEEGGDGWESPKLAPWLEQSIDRASRAFYGKPVAAYGEGGSIPFMAMLGERFPQAHFLITGVLGPRSNAHGPNEFLDISYAKKLTACIAQVLSDERSA
ncbi:MAG TPA: M20 family metallopeptidase [Thermoanaerobaculia bacterium]|nr:M20 family metallopeptidase [Thermoanaerobaculia bacterium]